MTIEDQIRESRQAHLHLVNGYVEQELLPAINYRGDVSVLAAEGGIRSLVYFLEGKNLGPFVLRMEESKKRCQRRVRGHQLLLRHGFNVPPIVHQGVNQAVRKKFGFFFLMEKRLAGVHFNKAPDTIAAASNLGTMLARMHAITSWRYGWPGELRWQGRILAGLQLRHQARAHLRIYRQGGRKFADKIEQWFAGQPAGAWFPKLRLTTAGLTGTNLLVDADRIAILDLARVRFTPVGRDLAQVRRGLTADAPGACKAFFDAYRRVAPGDLKAELKQCLPLFEALYLLRRAADVKNTGRKRACEESLLELCRD